MNFHLSDMEVMMTLKNLETPCLIVDIKKVKNNIHRIHKRMKKLGVNLRPHGKTPKNIDLLNMTLKGQSGGITVSTLKEAEYYFNNGIKDIIYAVGIAPVKLDRVAALIKKGADLSLILDSIAQVKIISDKACQHGIDIPVLIELDCDGHRSGVTLDNSLLLDIGNQIQASNRVTLRGVLTHAGESYQCKTWEAIQQIAKIERDVAVQCAELLLKNDLPCPVVSVGSTPTANFVENLEGVTEVRAGVFIFYDLVMAGLNVCNIEDIGLSVLTSVIGHQEKKGWVITDAGWMGLSRDRGTASQEIDQGYGLVCDINGRPFKNHLIVSGANQEHGIITASDNRTRFDVKEFKIGDMLRILPNHACATAAMYDRFNIIDNASNVTNVWHRINGW